MDNRGSLTPYAMSPPGLYSVVNTPPPLSPMQYTSWEGLVSYLGDNQLSKFNWVNPRSMNEQYQRVGCIADGNCLFHALLKALYPLYEQSYVKCTQICEEQLRKYENGLHPEAVKRVTRRAKLFTGSPYNRDRRSDNPERVYTIHHTHLYEDQMNDWRRAYTISFRWDFAQKLLYDSHIQGLIFTYLSGKVDMYVDAYLHQKHAPESARIQAQQKVLQDMHAELLTMGDVPADYLVILAEYAGVDFYLLRYSDLYQEVNSPLYGGDVLHRSIRGGQRVSIVILSINNNHYEVIGKTVGHEVKLVYRFPSDEPLIKHLFNILKKLRNDHSW